MHKIISFIPVIGMLTCSYAVSSAVTAKSNSVTSHNQQAIPPLQEILGNRKALVIGNAKYPVRGLFKSLTNPHNDAIAIAAKLQDYGFQVTRVADVGPVVMTKAIEQFISQLSNTDVALVYYSGHGISATCRNNEEMHNYLIPVTRVFNSRADLCEYAISVQWVLDRLNERGGGTNLLVLDACRNVLPKGLGETKGIESKGFVPMHDTSSFIGYAAAPKQSALGRKGGRYSLFTEKMLAAMVSPNDSLPVELLFKRVRAAVTMAAVDLGGQQIPWSDNGLTGDFCFRSPCWNHNNLDSVSQQDFEQMLQKQAQLQADNKLKNAELELLRRRLAQQDATTGSGYTRSTTSAKQATQIRADSSYDLADPPYVEDVSTSSTSWSDVTLSDSPFTTESTDSTYKLSFLAIPSPKTMPGPKSSSQGHRSPTLEQIEAVPNQLTDIDDWLADNEITSPFVNTIPLAAKRVLPVWEASYAFNDADYGFVVGQPVGGAYSLLAIMDPNLATLQNIIDFTAWAKSSPTTDYEDAYIPQELQFAAVSDGVLYAEFKNHTDSTGNYSGLNSCIIAVDLATGDTIWNSEPAVANAANFSLVDDTIITGHGLTGGAAYLYVLDRHSGQIMSRKRLRSAPKLIIAKGDTLYVRTHNTDYQFALGNSQ